MNLGEHISQKGITLIALVITIIVLLILAGVTLSMVLGDDGIISQAQSARSTQEESTDIEAITLAVAAQDMEIIANNGTRDATKLDTELEKKYGTGKIAVETVENEFKVTIDSDGNRIYKVHENGKVTKWEEVEPVVPTPTIEPTSTPELTPTPTDEITFALSGAGTSTNPYKISDKDDLTYFAEQVKAGNTFTGVYFELTENINLNNEEFVSISSEFNGFLDGKEHIISNLLSNSGGRSFMSKIGADSVVSNLFFENVNFTSGSGGFNSTCIFFNNYGVIKNCSIKNSCLNGFIFSTGLVTQNYGTIQGCSVSSVEISASGTAGGVVSQNATGGIVEGCTVSGLSVTTSTGYSGGVCGNANGGIIRNCSVSDITLTGENCGAIVGFNGGADLQSNINSTTYSDIRS